MNQLIELQYFGCITYFVKVYNSSHVILEQCESFQKMSFRNRCQILGADKVINLSVPLLGGRDQKALVSELQIDNQQRWQVQQWRTLESCYNKSAFFFYYGPELEKLLFQPYEKLWDLNEAAFNWVLKKLNWKGEIAHTETYERQPAHAEDNRSRFLPANREEFALPAYQQVFGDGFETNLSILDLLFNLGPQAGAYLKATGF